LFVCSTYALDGKEVNPLWKRLLMIAVAVALYIEKKECAKLEVSDGWMGVWKGGHGTCTNVMSVSTE